MKTNAEPCLFPESNFVPATVLRGQSKVSFCSTLLFALLIGSGTLCVAQVFDPRFGSGSLADTNLLSPVPNSGTLLIDYDFFTFPDTLDVFFEGKDIFSSGLLSGSGEFVIPYTGSDTSLMIVMNMDGNSNPVTVWRYQPTVVPEPGYLGLMTMGVFWAARKFKR